MKEKIYTIPVTEAFKEDCECPLCLLEKRFEEEQLSYILGPSLMEPDKRVETNKNGFCRRHFQLLYNKQENKLGLALILDTHLQEQNNRFSKFLGLKRNAVSFFKGISSMFSQNKASSTDFVDVLISELKSLEKSCVICSRLNYTIDRYIDVIIHLWFNESDFRKLFDSKKGFCLVHFRQLAEGAKKYLSSKDALTFVDHIYKMQIENMNRIQEEVNWFTKKFDYRYENEPWGNSKDAIPRAIQKLSGYCELK